MGAKDVDRLASAFTLGPEFDDILLRFWDDKQSNRFDNMQKAVDAPTKPQAA